MYNNKKILAIIPARGGSKGIKLKNLQKINGKTLIELVADVVNQIQFIDKVIVSTDHIEIKNEAIRFNLQVPFLRPDSLSGDFISDFQVIEDTLLKIEALDNTIYDLIILLQPTSPARTAEQIINAIQYTIDNDYDSVWSLSPTDLKSHPLKQLILLENKLQFYSNEGSNIIARQQLNQTYHRNGLFYIISRNCIMKHKSIFGPNSSAIIFNKIYPNIDTIEDLHFAEKFINSKNI